MYEKEDILKQADCVSNKIKALELIKQYQNVEQQIHKNSSIEQKMKQLKLQQKQSVNFQNYGKHQAYQKSEKEISQLEKEINTIPIVEEFRSAQFEANELLQLMVSTMEQSLNQHNEKAHHDS
ncbi:YlbF family regulator [Staphylococcus hominis]|uniref:RicAFT regulatory complex protein RicA family protein n=1 Tax=Staphylococcus hominis TaxID=1290 RepID=UPI001F55D7F7|nr:YlbF family regulator [Staphylococcus hominis]MCI2871843.1 YlbF family regulator [Staphylococcus hominis]MCI2876121.1 YlbF family regulator [Staphylococcus hominis]MCI2890688.1 YlbF family regulator [Staphylococcus hominis]MDS3867643.1 YlbF family regulator [Staphylococcus hominis]